MKTFIYTKAAPCKKVMVITDVKSVEHKGEAVIFNCKSGAKLEFDTKLYKTTSYTN